MFDVLTAGDPAGEPVLLLHGFPQTAACWTELAEALVHAGYRPLAPQPAGGTRGARPQAVRDYRMPELVADALALADRAGAGRFHLVDHDWGGAVAWHLAARHPQRVATLDRGLDPHPRAFAAALRFSAQPLRSAYIAFFHALRLPELAPGAHAMSGLRLLLAGSGLGSQWVAAYAGALAGQEALAAALAWYRAAGPSTLRVLSVVLPTCCLSGSGDPALAGGPPRLPPAGSPAPTSSMTWPGPATGCPSCTPPTWPARCWRTCGVGRSAGPGARGGRRDAGRGDRRRPGRAGSRHLAGPLPAHGAGAGLPEYRNRWAEASHGYLGRDPVAPAQLRARARAERAANPTTDFRTAKVVKVTADGLGGFEAATETERLAGRRLVLAAGSATSPRGGGICRAPRGERVLLPVL